MLGGPKPSRDGGEAGTAVLMAAKGGGLGGGKLLLKLTGGGGKVKPRASGGGLKVLLRPGGGLRRLLTLLGGGKVLAKAGGCA